MPDQNLDKNKEVVRECYEQCWNRGMLDKIGDFVSKDCRLHDPVFPSLGPGRENLRRHISTCRSGFPDLHFKIEDVIAERDEVVVHWTAQGTHQGQFLGLTPTQRRVSVSGTSIHKLANGKIVEQFADWNLMTLLEQIGAATAPKVQTTSG